MKKKTKNKKPIKTKRKIDKGDLKFMKKNPIKEPAYGEVETKKYISLRYFIYIKSEDGLLKEHYSSEYGSGYKTFNNYGQGYLSEMDAQEAIQGFVNENEYASISDLVVILKPIFI